MSGLNHGYKVGDELSAADTAAARDVINDIIHGRLKNGGEYGQEVVLRSCHDIDEAPIAPAHCPGHRHFELAIHIAHPESVCAILRVSAFEPGSDHVRVSVDDLLGTVAQLESSLGVVDEIAESICQDASHSERREYRRMLRNIERTENARADAFRALAADPLNWPPISGRALVVARVVSLYAVGSAVTA